jgi:serine/threonine protein phosphatase PrpC
MFKQTILWLTFCLATQSKLYFRIEKLKEGSIIPYPKNKKVGKPVFEDWYSSTPTAISVADGIGGVRFPTSHFAQILSSQVTHFLLDSREAVYSESKAFETVISDHALSEIENYNANLRLAIESAANEVSQKVGWKVSVNEQYFMAGATFISAAIENSAAEPPKLNIFQKGDSGLIIFRIKRHSEEINAYHYEPTYITKEQSYKFNMPFQFSNGQPSAMHQSAEQLDIEKGSIVLFGSDGLWDNLSLAFVTYVLNYSLFLSLKEELTSEKIDQIVAALAAKYRKKLKEDKNDIKRLAKSLFQTEKRSRFQMGGLVKMFVPNFLLPKKTPVTYNLDSEQIKSMIQESVGPLTDQEYDEVLQESDVPENDQNEIEEPDVAEVYFKHMEKTQNEFFNCNGADLTWENFAEVDGTPALSPCALESIRQGFLFTANDLKAISDEIDPQLISKIISRTTKQMTLTENHNYSPFFLHKVQFYGQLFDANGKPDDITVVTGIVTDKQPSTETLDSLKTAMENQKTTIFSNLKRDVSTFVHNLFHNELEMAELRKFFAKEKDSQRII